MRPCPECSHPNPDDATVCAGCAAPLGALDATRIVGPGSPAGETSAPDDPAHVFAPGTMLAGRYRIVALLGRGGMGTVYRADDLKLGHSVALKFLPTGLESDPDRLRRFLDEVRTARQVSHPNVCRVHDVDEIDGRHFLSMEYVDGEDLSSLLRRIGRLPEERAVTVARQICAGLSAAHEAGVLHRDLKPANVMLDGRGRVKLTDFGLASLVDDSDSTEVRAGTPAYMAPEQLAGREVTVRSDIYALGLVLYELFTGRPVFHADTVAELSSMHASSLPSRPSSHVRTLDPAIERAVLRCLEKDPAHRPASAIQVAAALPGGDPLAAALAAGEIPSPELVAGSGAREGLATWKALGLGVLAVALILGGSTWAASMSWIAYVPFEKRPAVLQDRATELIAELGYTEEAYRDPADRAWGWLIWNGVLQAVAAADSSSARWDSVRERPDVGGYWYRQSPRWIVPEAEGIPVLVRGPVGIVDPTASVAGEVSVLFDLDGSLRRFEALPRRLAREGPSEPDWTPLFEAAELDTSRFRSVPPRYQRFLAPDLRRAWVGTIAAQPGVEYRVEAGASEGRPVLFNVTQSSTLESLATVERAGRISGLDLLWEAMPAILILAVVVWVAVAATRNFDRERVDELGAHRFAIAMFMLSFLGTALRSHLLWTPQFPAEVWNLIAGSTFIAVVSWGLFVAAEPLCRQVWPSMFVSSCRMLRVDRTGVRDPLLGHSVLVGLIAAGLLFTVLVPGLRWLQSLFSETASWPLSINLDLVTGGRLALGSVLNVTMAVAMAFLNVAALVVIQRMVRRRRVSIVLAIVLWVLIDEPGTVNGFVISLLAHVGLMIVLLRWGALAMVVATVGQGLAWHARAVDLTHWTSEGAVFALIALVAMAAYGVWAATGKATATAH